MGLWPIVLLDGHRRRTHVDLSPSSPPFEDTFMKYLTPAILAATFALSSVPSVPVFASHPQGTDIEDSTRLTMRECLAMQSAKHDGASPADMKKNCKWTADETNSTYSLSSSERPRAVDATP